DDRCGSAPVDEGRAEDRIGRRRVRVEPEAVELTAQAFANQVEALRERLRSLAVANEHDLRGLRAALDDHLQIAREPQMRVVRVARDVRIHERRTDHARTPIDQRMLNDAVRHVDHVMRIQLEQPDLWRAKPAANGEAGAMAKPRQLTRDGRDAWKTVRN